MGKQFVSGLKVGAGATFLVNVVCNPSVRQLLLNMAAWGAVVGAGGMAHAVASRSAKTNRMLREVARGLKEEAGQNPQLREFLGQHRYVFVDINGGLVGTNQSRILGLGRIRLETAALLGKSMPLRKTVVRMIKRKYVQWKRKRQARVRPTRSEVEETAKRAVLNSDLAKRVGFPQNLSSIGRYDLEAIEELGRDTHTRIAKQKAIQYAMREIGIRQNQLEIRFALDRCIEREWQKELAGSARRLERDQILIENTQILTQLLGKRKMLQLLRLTAKKLMRVKID